MKSRPSSLGLLPRLVVRPVFWVALALVLIMALLPHPPRFPLDGYGDKAEHALAFAVLAALASMAWPRAPLWRVMLALSLLGALIEVFQAIPILHRDCDVRDWVADTIALVLVLAAVGVWRGLRDTARSDT